MLNVSLGGLTHINKGVWWLEVWTPPPSLQKSLKDNASRGLKRKGSAGPLEETADVTRQKMAEFQLLDLRLALEF